MGPEDYKQWTEDAIVALSKFYSENEVKIIMDWFSYFKCRDEIDLLGQERFDCMMYYIEEEDIGLFHLYTNMMSRLWRYAPLILKEAGIVVPYRQTK